MYYIDGRALLQQTREEFDGNRERRSHPVDPLL